VSRSERPERTWAFAHRGGLDGGFAPNSIAAFADALARGGQVATDVRLAADGVPVLIHDRISFVKGIPVVADWYPSSWLARLGVPRLADLYDELGHDFEISMDLKVVDAWPATLEVARKAGAVDRLWLVHDRIAVLDQVRAADADVRLMHEARPADLEKAGIALVDHPAILAKHRIDAQNTRAAAWTPAMLERAHAEGVFAFGSLVQTPDEQRTAAAKGLDGLYSDHLAGLLAAIAERDPRTP
jgi:glycerophosphoryl diester phosphodiesterase